MNNCVVRYVIISLFFLSNSAYMKTVDLIDVAKIVPTIRLDIRYATTNNFTHKVLYRSARCFLRYEVALQLKKVQKSLACRGLGLKIWDAYRPFSVQKKLWDAASNKRYVAAPAKGSNHNRGAAVDVTLIHLSNQKELEMPTSFDEFSVKAHADTIEGISPAAIEHRQILRDVMERHNFEQLPHEWWHFNYKAWRAYPILDIPFEELEK